MVDQSCSPHDGQKAEKARRKRGWMHNIVLEDILPGPASFNRPQSLSFCHFPITLSNYASINALIH